jgi:hypothetical protein
MVCAIGQLVHESFEYFCPNEIISHIGSAPFDSAQAYEQAHFCSLFTGWICEPVTLQGNSNTSMTEHGFDVDLHD